MKIEDSSFISKMLFFNKDGSWKLEVAGSVFTPAKSSNFQLLSF